MGIGIEPPSVNTSEFDFVVESGATVSGVRGAAAAPAADSESASRPSEPSRDRNGAVLRRGTIRFGLGAIKGVGEKAVGAIIEARERGGPFRNLFDFCERVDLAAVNKGTIEALVCAGAFDGTGAIRKALCDAVERAMAVGQAAQRDRRSGQ